VDCRVGLDAVVKRTILSPRQKPNPPNSDRTARSQSLYRLSHPGSNNIQNINVKGVTVQVLNTIYNILNTLWSIHLTGSKPIG
jgi:hypothetical protein